MMWDVTQPTTSNCLFAYAGDAVILNSLESRSRYRRGAANANCPHFSTANMQIQVVKTGEERNDSHFEQGHAKKGSVLKVACQPGFELNIAKKKVRCRRGEWRPATPICTPIKCRLPPASEGGRFTTSGSVILPREGEVVDGTTVELECDDGYFADDEPRRRCVNGEWTGGGAAMPTCTGNPCPLNEISGGGRFIGNGGNYATGQLIPHNAVIDFECPDLKSPSGSLRCDRGKLAPAEPECYVGKSKRKTSSWIGSHEISSSLVTNGDLLGVSRGDAFDPENDPGSMSTRLVQHREGCPTPQKVDGTLVYLSESREPLLFHGGHSQEHGMRFPHGSQVRFDCVPSTAADAENEDRSNRLRRSWKIVCEDGAWKGRFFDCGGEDEEETEKESEEEKADVDEEDKKDDFNASCAYTPKLKSNIVVFLQDRELKETEYLEPGAELLYRCVDIGKSFLLLYECLESLCELRTNRQIFLGGFTASSLRGRPT